MKVASPESELPSPPTEEKLRMLAERARRKEPLFPPAPKPEDATEYDHYLHIKQVHQSLTLYLSYYKANEHDDVFEITYTQIAKIIRTEPDKPGKYAHQLPLPDSNPTIRTSRYVWKWHDVKPYIRRLMASMAIKELAGRL